MGPTGPLVKETDLEQWRGLGEPLPVPLPQLTVKKDQLSSHELWSVRVLRWALHTSPVILRTAVCSRHCDGHLTDENIEAWPG